MRRWLTVQETYPSNSTPLLAAARGTLPNISTMQALVLDAIVRMPHLSSTQRSRDYGASRCFAAGFDRVRCESIKTAGSAPKDRTG